MDVINVTNNNTVDVIQMCERLFMSFHFDSEVTLRESAEQRSDQMWFIPTVLSI